MLKDLWTDPQNWQVVVLDFDLSWHRGAPEESIHIGAGYLAPEQVMETLRVSTRHAGVDSYGLGMTLFYILAGRDPAPLESQHEGWEETVNKAVRNWPCARWISLPIRFARLLQIATRFHQSERWDLSQIERELERLRSVLESPKNVIYSELAAEEVMARACEGVPYTWNADKLEASLELPSGIGVRIQGSEEAGSMLMVVDFATSGEHPRKRIIRWMPRAKERIEKLLTGSGWTITRSSLYGGLHMEARVETRAITPDLERVSQAVGLVRQELEFK